LINNDSFQQNVSFQQRASLLSCNESQIEHRNNVVLSECGEGRMKCEMGVIESGLALTCGRASAIRG
jgi:hypothetical protein